MPGDMMQDPAIPSLVRNIGGHAAAAILNVHPFITAIEIYWSLRGELPQKRDVESEQLKRGKMLEPVILDRYAEENTKPINRINVPKTHTKYPDMIALPDARVVGQKTIVDAKAVHFREKDKWGEPGTDEVPDYISIQQQFYLAIYQYEQADIPVWFTEQDFEIYTVYQDFDMQQYIVDACLDFRDMCLAGNPPMVNYEHPRLNDVIRRRYPGTNGKMIELSEDFAPWFDVYEQAVEMRGKYEKIAEAAKAHITLEMQDHAVAKVANYPGRYFVRKEVKRKGYTVEPSQSMQMRMTSKQPQTVQDSDE